MKLNDRQKEVIEHPGNIVTAAPPGSGKTRVLVEKTRTLLSSTRGKIKLVTFTRAAASEMKKRIGRTGQGRVEAATFDSYCLRMARQAGLKLSPPNPVHEWTVLHDIAKAHFAGDTQELEEEMAKASHILRLENAPKDARELYELYIQELAKHDSIDFASIARRVVFDLYRGGQIKPLEMDHLLVDEFQDADQIQVAWVLAHAKYGATVMVVGDDDQSIYSWRGGMGYDALEQVHKRLNAKVITLDTCYRCRPEVVEAARMLIHRNTKRFHKPIITPRPLGGSVVHMDLKSQSEAINAIPVIAASMGWPKCAIIARRNADLAEYDKRISVEGRNVVRIGGKDFWSTIGAVMGLEVLKIFINPNPKSKAFKTFMKYTTGDENTNDAKICTEMLIEMDYVPSQHAIVTKGLEALITRIIEYNRDRKEAVTDQECVRAMEELAALNDTAPFVSHSNFVGSIQTILELTRKGKVLQDVVNIIEGMKSNRKKANLDNADIVICTMHASKGMEFPLVFIVAANDNITPGTRVDEGSGVDDERDQSSEDEQKFRRTRALDLLEEERRLFYVALTRAEDHAVVISYRYAQEPKARKKDEDGHEAKRSAKLLGPPSRFIGQAGIKIVEAEEYLEAAELLAEKLQVLGDDNKAAFAQPA